MKVRHVILFLVVISAIYIGLNINNESFNYSSADSNEKIVKNHVPAQESEEKKTSLSPTYIMDYLKGNGFEISPTFSGTTSDIYTAKYTIPDSQILVQVDVYFERSSQQILLIESNIDASWYITETNQKYYEEYVNKAANNYFSAFASLPYAGSEPNVAIEWVQSNILTSYSSEPKERTSTSIGPATINIFGSPLFRTLEIDFGF